MAVLARPGYNHPDVHAYTAYHGPPAPLAHDGRVVDTPEVAHAKAAHFHAYNEELSKTSHYGPGLDGGHYDGGHYDAAPHVAYNHDDHQVYHGPPAPLGHDGRVVDTPEVSHAKAAHFHAYNEELSKTAHHGPHYAQADYHYWEARLNHGVHRLS